MQYADFLAAAAQVRPTARQLDWYRHPFYAFAHFGPNTFTGREWGDGTEDPAIFRPEALDCDEWVAAIKAAGMTGLVLTAKHHDGFCLWPSQHTEHSVKSSPWRGGKGDVVREAAEACCRGGIRFGFYLSPWDRHSPLYGTPAYNDYYKAQLTELLTGYGPIFHVWFDGACGEGPNGRRQEYDFPGYIALVRQYQPDATIFCDYGPDVRWIGNESGQSRAAEWAVVPSELCPLAPRQTEGPLLPGTLEGIGNTRRDIGGLDVIQYSRGLCFCPAEVDMSLRPGWFYHPEEEPHELSRLLKAYTASVGNNAALHLNVPPMPNGRLNPRDIARLRELGEALQARYGHPLEGITVRREGRGDSQCVFCVTLPEKARVHAIELREDIAQGQRVAGFVLDTANDFSPRDEFYQGATIGARKLCDLDEERELREFRIVITAARGPVDTLEINVHGE